MYIIPLWEKVIKADLLNVKHFLFQELSEKAVDVRIITPDLQHVDALHY